MMGYRRKCAFYPTLAAILIVCALYPSQATAQDCNANGIPDATDIVSGTSLDCNANGVPDECDITVVTSTIFSDVPFSFPVGVTQDAATGDFIVIDQGSAALFRVASGGVVTTIASGPPFSRTVDVTQDAATGDFIVIDNGNDTLFRIRSPISADCNANGIPDECDTCGDFDGDADVNGDDFAILLNAFGLGPGAVGFEPCADFDGDGLITLVDYQQWLQCFRSFIGNPLAPPPTPESVGDMDGSGGVDGRDIQPFVDAMLDPATAGLRARFMSDANGDGAVDSADAGEFVGLLLSQQ